MNIRAAGNWISQYWLYLVIAFILLYHLLDAYTFICPFEGDIVDGPFQFYNWLRRIDAGEIPSRDFDCFHGCGIPLLHYPVYKLLGSDLFAAEYSRQIVSRIATLLVYLAVSKLTTGKLQLGVFWSLFTLYPAWRPTHSQLRVLADYFLNNLTAVAEPLTSLYGLRTLLPLLFVALLFYKKNKATFFASAVCLAMAYLLGIEQGLALYVATLGVCVVLLAGSYFNRSLLAIAGYLAAVVVAALAIDAVALTIICSPSGLERFFRFHYVYQANDQMWYFGITPLFYFFDGNNYTKLVFCMLLAVAGVSFGIIAFLLRKVIRSQERADNEIRVANILGLSYGLLSCAALLGYVFATNFLGYYRMAVVLLSIYVYRNYLPAALSKRQYRLCVAFVVAALIMPCWTMMREVTSFKAPHLSATHQQHLDIVLETIRSSKPEPVSTDLWSFYSGLVEAKLGIYQPSKYDMVIHALGQNRQRYQAEFAALETPFVQTIRTERYAFEEWMRTTNYPLYEQLLKKYRIVGKTPYTVIWRHLEPGESPARMSDWQTVQPKSPNVFVIPKADFADCSFLVFRVRYSISNPLRNIPLLGQSARYLAEPKHGLSQFPVSLPPQFEEHTFPVFLKPDQDLELDFLVRGLNYHAAIRVESLEFKRVFLQDFNQAFLDDLGRKE